MIGYFLNQTQEIRNFVLLAVKKKSHLSARMMARTVQLLRHDAYCLLSCPIKAKIRAVDSQSDLTILL